MLIKLLFLSFQREDELCRLMNVYIKDHRPKLVTASSQRYLLLVSFETRARERLASLIGVVNCSHSPPAGPIKDLT